MQLDKRKMREVHLRIAEKLNFDEYEDKVLTWHIIIQK